MMMNELDLLLNEFGQAVEQVQNLASQIRGFFSTKEETIEEELTKEVSFTELRALCANRSRAGFTDTIRDMILDTGAKKLSEVEPSKYSELYQRVEALK